MMDAQLIFAEDFAGTTAAQNYFTDLIDIDGGVGLDAFGTTIRGNPGLADGSWINFCVNTAAASTDATSTVVFRLESCATTNGTYTDHQDWESRKYLISELTAGTRIRGKLPPGLLRYVKASVQPATTLTAGNFSAYLTMGTESDK